MNMNADNLTGQDLVYLVAKASGNDIKRKNCVMVIFNE